MTSADGDTIARVSIKESDKQVDLLLRDFRPEQMVKLPEHHPKRFPTPAYDAHNHLGRWHTDGWAVKDVPAFVAMLDEVNVHGVVNLDGAWGD
jgi:hypothetical protein